jgi:hypothetical protein
MRSAVKKRLQTYAISVWRRHKMKCAACGYRNGEDYFSSALFLSVQIYDDGNNHLSRIENMPVHVLICPKCRTLKMKKEED